MPLPKMRGPAEAIHELHNIDPSSGLTLHALRQLVNTGEVPCIRCGHKILINMDNLYNYLYGDNTKQEEEIGKRNITPIAIKQA
ncbi:hypothetical protein SDC9_104803 [bioreactor metagenome]|uniref:DNA-binding protein n=1 Tax=bioreactor metagenome TaxID=1076179 RepID=A0A645B8F2_9ZZZZ|nr:DNA-binding protein [Oscillospiraceae bacterium]